MYNFYNRERNKEKAKNLYQALMNRDKSNINTGSITLPQKKENKEDDVWGGANSLLSGGAKLYKGLQGSGLFGGSGSSDFGIIGNAANNYVSGTPDYGSIGNAANNFISSGVSSEGSAIGNAINSEVGSGLGNVGGGFMPYVGIAQGGLRAGQSALEGGSWSDAPQSFFGIDSENDSEIMQAVKGAGQGASMGAAFGPYGAAIGGLLGLGASFLDDF